MSFPIFQEQDYGGMLGRAIGDSLGGGFHTGILNQYQQQQQRQNQQREMSSLQEAISQAGNDPESQLKALLTAPVSNETKKLAIQSFQNQQQMAQQGLQKQEAKNKQERLFEQQEKLQNKKLQHQQQLQKEKIEEKRQRDLEKQRQIADLTGSRIGNESLENIESQESPNTSQYQPENIDDEKILKLSTIDPMVAKIVQSQKKQAELLKQKEKKFHQEERAFETGYSKEAVKKANNLRESLPRKEMAANFARDAVESGDVSFFSKDKLADATGLELFRTAKGAQLITAAKENLIANLSRVSARAQNQWMEQKMNSVFAHIGQSKESNLTTQEMIEAEIALDRAYLNEFDRLQKQDNELYGFERKDIEERARRNIEPIEKDIFNRSSLRIKEIDELEKGLDKLKKDVGKPVSKGTPMTLAMAKLYHEKFGDKALETARKNGYKIPTLEEYRAYRASPQEFRENL